MSDVTDLGSAKVTNQWQMQVLKRTVRKHLKLEVGNRVQFWLDENRRIWIEKVIDK